MQNKKDLLKQYSDLMLLKDFSYNTTKDYLFCLTHFLDYISEKEICDIAPSDAGTFINYLITEKHISVSFQKQYIAAITLFYRETLNIKDIIQLNNLIDLPHYDKSLKVPCILTKDEVKAIIAVPENIKDKLMLSLLYSCALHLHEMLDLRIKDIDLRNKLIKIYKDNDFKDREIIITDKLIEFIKEYFFNYKINYWLFESSEGIQNTERSVQYMFKKCLIKTGIKKNVSVNSLRHSYATHLSESGIDIQIIKKILGHHDIKSTKTYTSLSHVNQYSIYNPFNDIFS